MTYLETRPVTHRTCFQIRAKLSALYVLLCNVIWTTSTSPKRLSLANVYHYQLSSEQNGYMTGGNIGTATEEKVE